MTSDRRRRIDEVVGAALSRPPDERAAFLDAACGDDEALRRDADSLLAREAEAADLLEVPPWHGLSSAAEPLTAGTRLGPYEIKAAIGAGGMGDVYRARDTRLERTVAIKVLPPELAANATRLGRFEREARAVAALAHPHICTLFDIGVAVPLLPESRAASPESRAPSPAHLAPVHYLVMEHLEGESLAARLRRGSIPVTQVLDIGAQIADALSAAHRSGIVHRDLKPANIMLTRNGGSGQHGLQATLLDFGLAKLTGHGERPAFEGDATTLSGPVSSPGLVFGTLPYMAPEQIEGRGADARADIWALGAVLYEMLSGARAFAGETPAKVAAAIIEREPGPVTARQPLTPPSLARLIATCLAKDPEARWQSAHDVADELRWIGRAGAAADQGPKPQRRVWPFVGLAAALLLLAAGAVGAWRWLRPPERLPDADPQQVTSGPGWESEPRISPDGSDIVYAAEGEGGNVDLWLVDARGGSAIRLTTDPAVDRSPEWYPDRSAIAFVSERGGETAVWKVPRLGGAATLVMPAADAPAISPDGTRVAFTRPDERGLRRIAVAPLDDTDAARLLTTDRDGLWDHRTPAWSPDGRAICYAGQRDLWIVPASGGPAARLTTDDQYDSTPVYSPRSGFLYFSSFREGTNAIWRVAQRGGRPARVTLGVGPEVQPSLSLDATRLVYSTFSTNSDLVIVDRSTGAGHAIGGERNEVSPALAPDGLAVAFASDRLDGRYDLWLQALDAQGRPAGEAVRLTDHPGAVTHPRFSPDGTRIVYQRAVEGQRDIWIVARAGGAPVRFTDDPGADTLPEWSPDGREIAFISERGGAARVWVAPAPGISGASAARPITSPSPAPFSPAWSPDGRTIAYAGGTPAGGAEIWLADPAGAAPPRQLTHAAMAHRAVWVGPRTLLVSGTWKSGRLRVMRVDAATGAVEDAGYPGLFGLHSQRGEFVVSADGRLLAAVRQRARGDIWLLQAVRGNY